MLDPSFREELGSSSPLGSNILMPQNGEPNNSNKGEVTKLPPYTDPNF